MRPISTGWPMRSSARWIGTNWPNTCLWCDRPVRSLLEDQRQTGSYKRYVVANRSETLIQPPLLVSKEAGEGCLLYTSRCVYETVRVLANLCPKDFLASGSLRMCSSALHGEILLMAACSQVGFCKNGSLGFYIVGAQHSWLVSLSVPAVSE